MHICRPGFEETLARELMSLGYKDAVADGPGLVSVPDAEAGAPADLCYATLSLLDPVEVTAGSVNALAGALCDLFGTDMRGVRLIHPWLLHWECAGEGLQSRCRSVAREFDRRLQRRMGRVARLATAVPRTDSTVTRGLVVIMLTPERVIASTHFRCWGQRRMRWDPRAPSRSYLKLEEAFALLGAAPSNGDTVVDLGAAPGGWSYSAAARGATVWAVDNGPLKGAAHQHERIHHCRDDAFTFTLPRRKTADWLLCDLIETPARVVEGILLPWLDNGWCRRFVVNVKVGRDNPIEILRRLRAGGQWSLPRRCANARIRHLYHDREEFTCLGVMSVNEGRLQA